MIIDSAKYTCPGGHEINEDSLLCNSDKGIFIVADGLGGHSDGEKASKAAIDFFEENCLGGNIGEGIIALMEGANTRVLQDGDGGKTTVAAAFIENGNFIYANAGDSRVYYFRDGKIIAQTKDHSVCQAAVDMGMMRPEDIRGNEDRSRLLKVLGGEEKVAIKKPYPPIKIQTGDAFLICSDGFWEYVYEAEMEADLLKSGSADIWLKYMLKRHILRAENKGDNYTAICGIIHTEEGDPVGGSAPAGNVSSPNGKQKKSPLRVLIICAVAALIVAAAVIAGILLLGGSDNDEPDTSSTPVETPDESASDTTPDTTPEEGTADTSDTSDTTAETEDTSSTTADEPETGTTTEEPEPTEPPTDPTTPKPEEPADGTTNAITTPDPEEPRPGEPGVPGVPGVPGEPGEPGGGELQPL